MPPARDGGELPSARRIRTTLLGDGYFREHHFSTLSTHFYVFAAIDNVELFYLRKYHLITRNENQHLVCCVFLLDIKIKIILKLFNNTEKLN